MHIERHINFQKKILIIFSIIQSEKKCFLFYLQLYANYKISSDKKTILNYYVKKFVEND